MTNYYVEIDDLVHYGIKGMKWGVRKDHEFLSRIAGAKRDPKTLEKYDKNSEVSRQYKEYKKNTKFMERRKDVAAAREEKAQYLIEKALKNPASNLYVSTGRLQVLSTGKSFLEYMMAGGVADVVYTDFLDD